MTLTRSTQLSAFDDIVAPRPVGSVLTSISAAPTNAELIESIAPLYLDGLTLDVTYGKGGWWSKLRPENLIAADLDPTKARTVRADFTRLPFSNRSVDAVAYDPPYIPHGGINQTTDFAERFGLAGGRSRSSMDNLIAAGLSECKRVTRKWVLVKCTDYTNGRQFHLGHVAVANAASELDLEPWDLIVHAAGIGPGHNLQTQLRARRAHSYLMVYRRRSRERA